MFNIIDIYDFEEIVNQYNKYETWLNYYKSLPNSKAKKQFCEETPKPEYIKPRLRGYELELLDTALADIKLIRNEKGLVSASASYNNIGNPKLKAMIQYLAKLQSRSELYLDSASKHPEFCSLVPLWMAANKKHNNVMYEEWDKEDKFIRAALGFQLYNAIWDFKDKVFSDDLRNIVRRNALMTKEGKPIDPTSWPKGSVKVDGSITLYPGNLFRHIWLQTWMANVKYRNEFMILDIHNWDNMPEALDVYHKPEIEAVRNYINMSKTQKPDLPW